MNWKIKEHTAKKKNKQHDHIATPSQTNKKICTKLVHCNIIIHNIITPWQFKRSTSGCIFRILWTKMKFNHFKLLNNLIINFQTEYFRIVQDKKKICGISLISFFSCYLSLLHCLVCSTNSEQCFQWNWRASNTKRQSSWTKQRVSEREKVSEIQTKRLRQRTD